MGVITRGVRNAFRNKIRTFAIVLILAMSIGLSLTMYLADQAVSRKIDSVKQLIGTTITVRPAGAQNFSGGGEPLTDADVSKVKALPHASSIAVDLTDQLQPGTDTNLQSAVEPGTLGQRRFRGQDGERAGGPPRTLPVFVTGVSSIDDLKALGTGSASLTSGTFDGNQAGNTAIVGKDLATKNNLSAGSTFQAFGQAVTVSGTYDAGNRFAGNSVVFPLETLRRLANEPGQSTAVAVKADSITNADGLANGIKQALGDKADVTAPSDQSSQAVTPLISIQAVATYSLIGAVAAGAIIIFLAMLMIVRERRREIGVLKAIGASNGSIVRQFIVEAFTFTGISAIVGMFIGILFSGPVTRALVTSNATSGMGGPGMGGGGRGLGRILGGQGALRDIHAAVGYDVILYGLAAAFVIALVGSAIPAWLIAKVRPAEVMRSE